MSKEDTKVLLTFAHVGETEKSSLRGSGKKNEEQNCKKEVEERCLCWLTLRYWFLSALKKLIGGEQVGRSQGREKRWILATLLPLLLRSYYSGLETAELTQCHMHSDPSPETQNPCKKLDLAMQAVTPAMQNSGTWKTSKSMKLISQPA